MSRYIDADALTEKLDEGLWGKDWDKALAEAMIQQSPSIDIVFCYECKHKNNCEKEVVLTSMYNEIEESAEINYCSYGERSE